MTRASVIIPVWNGAAYLGDCLDALLAEVTEADEIIAVDNASSDDSAVLIRQHYPGVRLLQQERNLGFAGGCNAGIRAAQGQALLLLNQDVVVRPGWLAAMLRALAPDSVGVAGCKLYYPGGSNLQHAGGYLLHPQALPGHYGLGDLDHGQYDTSREVDYVIGAALAVKRDVLDRAGLLDEGFFLFFEDADLCTRVQRLGYRVVYDPEPQAVHAESAASRKGSTSYLQHMFTSRWRYILKHFAPGEVLEASLPAERAWLLGCPGDWRSALHRAYAATLAELPEILAARERDGGAQVSPFTSTEQAALRDGLQALLAEAPAPGVEGSTPPAVAQPPSATTLDRLADLWELHEQPFESHLPVLGPLVVRFREAWNSVSTRWFVRRLVQQQNEFNWQILQHAREQEARLSNLLSALEAEQRRLADAEELLVRQDRDRAAAVHDLAEVSARLIALDRSLADLERQARTEETGRSGGHQEP